MIHVLTRHPTLLTIPDLVREITAGSEDFWRGRRDDLAAGRLRVTDAKTDAGVRQVDLLPALREELSIHKAQTRFAGPDDFVFPTESGARQIAITRGGGW